ncbi:hypothetical protein J6590_067427 [Homalodisca vitripennis]|nr:hypothetical protein J6590_067427 [Homalodisca vitripennis]
MPPFFQVSVPTVRSLEQNSLRVRKSKPLFNRMQVLTFLREKLRVSSEKHPSGPQDVLTQTHSQRDIVSQRFYSLNNFFQPTFGVLVDAGSN